MKRTYDRYILPGDVWVNGYHVWLFVDARDQNPYLLNALDLTSGCVHHGAAYMNLSIFDDWVKVAP